MFRWKFVASLLLALVGFESINAQQISSLLKTQQGGGYSYTEAFAPFFYKKNGNQYRSASGKPGHEYWQNRADYQIDVRLNDVSNEVSGTEVITYTNNSPDDLEFLWLQLDQNIFKRGSKGNIIVPPTGSRNGGHGQVFDAGYKIGAVKLLSGSSEVDLDYLIDDTRMQIFLPAVFKAKGGQLKLKIQFSFIKPE